MTALSTPVSPATTEDRSLAALLREDGLVTAAVGVAALLATALAGDRLWGDVPTWLAYAVAAVVTVVGADLLLASRLTGRRLRLAATVTMELAAAWVLGSVAVLVLVDLPTAGALALGAVAVVTAGFGVAYARLLR